MTKKNDFQVASHVQLLNNEVRIFIEDNPSNEDYLEDDTMTLSEVSKLYNTLIDNGRVLQTINPINVWSGVIPVVNKDWILFSVKPHEYLNGGVLDVFGGYLKPKTTPFENAIERLSKQLVIYDVKAKKIKVFEFADHLIHHYKKLLYGKYGFVVNDVEIIDENSHTFVSIDNMSKIKTYVNGQLKEENNGYVVFDFDKNLMSIYFVLLVKDIDVNSTVFIYNEYGGELAHLSHMDIIERSRGAYFNGTLKSAIKEVLKNRKFFHHPLIL